MSRETWNLIKNSKRFYVNTYRRSGTALIFSILLNIFLVVVIGYIYFNEPEPDFYATSGITPPVKMTSLDEPNYTSVPLLADEPESEDETRVIPQ